MFQTEKNDRKLLHESTKWLFILVLISVGWFYWSIRPAVILHRGDTLCYVAGAQSLAEGTGYRMVLYEDGPRIGLYPPLQSCYLSLFWPLARFPNFSALNAAMVGLLVAVMAMLYISLARSGFAPVTALLVAACMALQPHLYQSVFCFLSDLLFSLLSFFLAALWLREPQPPGKLPWLLTGVTLGLMFLARTAAAPVLLGLCGLLLLRGLRYRDWKPVVVAGLPMLAACLLWKCLPKETATYADYYRERMHSLASGNPDHPLRAYLLNTVHQALDYTSTELIDCFGCGLPRFLSALAPHSTFWWHATFLFSGLIAAGCMVFCAIGYWNSKTGILRAVGTLLGLYLLEMIVWPFPSGPRAILPMIPFICFGCRAGLNCLPSTWQPCIARSIALLLAVGILPSAYLTHGSGDVRSQPERQEDLQALAVWSKQNVSPSSRLITEHDCIISDFPMIHFVALSGHKLCQTPCAGWRSIAKDADYLLMEAFPPLRNSVPILGQQSPAEVVYRTPRNYFQVLKLHNDGVKHEN